MGIKPELPNSASNSKGIASVRTCQLLDVFIYLFKKKTKKRYINTKKAEQKIIKSFHFAATVIGFPISFIKSLQDVEYSVSSEYLSAVSLELETQLFVTSDPLFSHANLYSLFHPP